MVRIVVSAVLGALGLSVHVSETAPAALPAKQPAPSAQCVQLKVDQMGQLPLEVQVGATKVRFTAWKTADAQATQWVGFTYESTAQVRWVAQSGERSVYGVDRDWLLPDAFRGQESRVLTSLRLCPS